MNGCTCHVPFPCSQDLSMRFVGPSCCVLVYLTTILTHSVDFMDDAKVSITPYLYSAVAVDIRAYVITLASEIRWHGPISASTNDV
jgi:hypothetical protein